jgi:hypothetical protein
LAYLVIVVGGLSLAAPLEAQSGATAIVSGTVGDPSNRPIPGTLVTLTSLDRGDSRETTADGAGAFRFALVSPGSYELRAEALGYRPVVARTLALAGGGRAAVGLTMVQATPPVLRVDTVAVVAAGGSRFVPGGLRLGSRELGELPHRFNELASPSAAMSRSPPRRHA